MNLTKYFVFFCCTAFLIDCSQVASGSSEDEASIAESSSSGRETISSSAKSNYNTSSSTDVQDEKCTGDSGTPWDGTTAKDFACGAGTKLSPYIILTAEQLEKFNNFHKEQMRNFRERMKNGPKGHGPHGEHGPHHN